MVVIDRGDALREVLDWHREMCKVAQSQGDVLVANATLEAALKVLTADPSATTFKL